MRLGFKVESPGLRVSGLGDQFQVQGTSLPNFYDLQLRGLAPISPLLAILKSPSTRSSTRSAWLSAQGFITQSQVVAQSTLLIILSVLYRS